MWGKKITQAVTLQGSQLQGLLGTYYILDSVLNALHMLSHCT